MNNENMLNGVDSFEKIQNIINKSEENILMKIESATNALHNEIQAQNQFENNRKESEAFYNKRINDLNREIDLLKAELSKSVDEKALLYKETESIKKEIISQVELLKEQYEIANNKLSDYEAKYKKLDTAYLKYQEISVPIKERLRNLIDGSSFLPFVVSGSKLDNIIGLWYFIQTRIKEEELDDVPNLKNVFYFLLEVYCQSNAEKPIHLIEPNVGERFDSDNQIILGNETDGWIESIVLPGLFDSTANRGIEKAIVTVKPY